MGVTFFTIPFSERTGSFDASLLEEFLADKEVLYYKVDFFKQGDKAYWTLFIDYRLLDIPEPIDTKRKEEILKNLTDDQHVVFQRIKAWRLELSKQKGIPAFVILRDEQVLNIVKVRPSTLHQLLNIPGIGRTTVNKYGRDIMRLLGTDMTAQNTVQRMSENKPKDSVTQVIALQKKENSPELKVNPANQVPAEEKSKPQAGQRTPESTAGRLPGKEAPLK